MDPETARIEHLKIIQAVIDRMGRNSFAIKAGSLTVVAGLLALTLGINCWKLSAIGTIPVAMLWGLDTFFIRQERIFRRLYDTVRLGLAPEIGSAEYFSMNTQRVQSEVNGLLRTMFSRTLPLFYIPLLLILIIIAIVT
jgi:hypothetical protein